MVKKNLFSIFANDSCGKLFSEHSGKLFNGYLL